MVVKNGILYDKGKVTFGRSKRVANAKKEMNAPEGKDIVLATIFQSKPEGGKCKVQIEGLVENRWDGLECQVHSHVTYPNDMGSMARHLFAPFPEGTLFLRRLHLCDFKGATENSAVRKYLPYLSKKSTNIFWATIMNWWEKS